MKLLKRQWSLEANQGEKTEAEWRAEFVREYHPKFRGKRGEKKN